MEITSSYSQITLYSKDFPDDVSLDDFPEWSDDLDEKIVSSNSAIFIATEDDSLISVQIQESIPFGMTGLGSYLLKTRSQEIILSSPDYINSSDETVIRTEGASTLVSIFCDSLEGASEIVLVLSKVQLF